VIDHANLGQDEWYVPSPKGSQTGKFGEWSLWLTVEVLDPNISKARPKIVGPSPLDYVKKAFHRRAFSCITNTPARIGNTASVIRLIIDAQNKLLY